MRKQGKTGKRKKWGSSRTPLRTSKATQARVVGHRMAGETYDAISKKLELDPETVVRILSQEENELLLQSYRQSLTKIVPNALIQAYDLVDHGDRQMVTDVLRGARVMVNRHEVATAPPPVQDYSYSRVLFFGKYKRWPTDEEAVKFQKTITIKPTVKGQLTD